MSPAGHWPQMQAAIDAGADAVYFGMTHFSARAKVGFTQEELPQALDLLHRHGVRGYITFNTLVFEHELEGAAQAIETLAQAGADALIVQDIGVAKLAREIAPSLELHASTQMSITNSEGVRLAQSLGLNRVTLARELSLPEIERIYRETGCDLEIFVHGALCVAYSGQCLSSEAWGGRSANRGQCAQACRLPYEMVVDGVVEPLGDARYLLSPGDLYALEQVPEIVRIGVAALKIEGRYKDAEYVAITTRAYRNAVDAACSGESFEVRPTDRLQLEQVYSRGLGPFFLNGTDHQAVVTGRAPRHRGVLMGTVREVGRAWIAIEPSEKSRIDRLKPGDGVVFDAASWRSPQEPEEGGRLYEVRQRLDGWIELAFANRAIQADRIRPGDLLWRTHDPEIARAVEAMEPARQRISVRVIAHTGEPLHSTWTLERKPGISVGIHSPSALTAARNRALEKDLIAEQLGRLGSTVYVLGDVDLEIEGNPFVPVSLLNALRREAVSQLEALQTGRRAVPMEKPSLAVTKREALSTPPRLHLLVRTPDQLDASIEFRPASITLDYLDLYGLRPSVERVRSSGIAVRVASPRVLKPGESRIQNFLADLNCAIVVRSAAMLQALSGCAELIGDFSLNAANSLSAEAYLAMGATRVTPAHDLNAAQISDLANRIGGGSLEVVAYQHLPVFHTEHCVFCRFLSTGTSYKDCGRPCEAHRVALKDENGREHPVMADVGCRNTVFGAEAQQAASHLTAWMGAGIRDYRLEFVHEAADQVVEVSGLWQDAIRSRITPAQLDKQLRRIAPHGVTEGSLFVPAGYLTLPVLQ